MPVKVSAEDQISFYKKQAVTVEDYSTSSFIINIIKHLRKNMDLHRITLPAFILEPRSMLEKVTDFMSHPDILLEASQTEHPLDRFMTVVKFYLSGWHNEPKNVKKPYNPILGEQFKCKYKYDFNGKESDALFVAEQVSHHPPISAYYYSNPENNIVMKGNISPKSRFLGTCVGNFMEGDNCIMLKDETYTITMPNMYVKGILFGRMELELGGQCYVDCKETGFRCELEFKTKGFFTGERDVVVGNVIDTTTGQIVCSVSGNWADKIYMTKEGVKSILFDASTAISHPKIVAEIKDQGPLESRRVWSKVTDAIHRRDMDTATDEKTVVEDNQRQERNQRAIEGKPFVCTYFDYSENKQIHEFKIPP
ncbi:hypothetical protein INT47_006237, partial [Mucor saturninus]